MKVSPTVPSDRPELLVLLGPTAVGKTKISLEIAKRFDCEIISGDSMQVYRGMDIGTAKVTQQERAVVRHHMVDIRDPNEPFSVAEFQEQTRRLIDELNAAGKLPFIVGGTGLYIESVCYGYRFSEGGSDEAYRDELKRYAERYGSASLHGRLRSIDPDSADKIHPNDQRRIIRALEVFRLTGQPLSAHLRGQNKQSPYQLCLIGLTMDRNILYKRIEDRIDMMMREGLVEEVRALLERGCTRDMVSMQGLGYKEIAGFLAGEYTLDEAVKLLKRNTRRFAKRQLSWFRHMKEIEWVDVTDSAKFSAHVERINGIIARKFPSRIKTL